MRPSSPEFSKAFASGATARGADVELLDLIAGADLPDVAHLAVIGPG